MKWRLVQFSAVVVGQAHNPTILNPDFLAAQGIVPKSWGWTVADTVTTPPLALVRYSNDVSITVEQNKLQVADPNVENGPEGSKVTEIAAAYVQILPHVRYTATGNNFQVLIPHDSPAAFLKGFLSEGSWSTTPAELDTVGLKLRYPLENGGHLTLSLDAGEAKLPDKADQQQVVVATANFNRSCPDQPAAQTATEHLQQADLDWTLYKHTLTTLFPSQDK